ncbi:GNAT family N-acetyltransferase [Niveispirillum sp.]|uniref:GNAT family N-acetyltransferase n=1 Tax=Niveispirillum sp. TaxID=1917217 RepID=UPI001B41744F|nr:GNAT family N-acetyltransferase [Niveispirillum sp.]MBP7338194.1 GNAT family N-acetyltransferase [Niveispirillum sp.]
MADSVEIVAAGSAHAPVLAALHALAFADAALSGPAWDAGAFASLLSTPGVEAFILLVDGTPLALSLWRHVLDEGELLTIGTDPAAQGRGLGTALLRQGLAHLAAAGVTRCFLEVAVTNTAAINLYASCGFTNAGRRRGYYQHAGKSIDAHVMVTDGELGRII